MKYLLINCLEFTSLSRLCSSLEEAKSHASAWDKTGFPYVITDNKGNILVDKRRK